MDGSFCGSISFRIAAIDYVLRPHGVPENRRHAEDRAQIIDLQARYLFALDFLDMDSYVSTFTDDGILDIIEYQAKGREEIRNRLEESRPVFDQSAESTEGQYPPTGRHNITNIVLKIDVNTAVGRAYWFHWK